MKIYYRILIIYQLIKCWYFSKLKCMSLYCFNEFYCCFNNDISLIKMSPYNTCQLQPVSHCPKVRTAMMKVIGAYTATIFLLDFMENVILLHNPLPYVWESLHLGLATITVLLVVAYLTYITIKVYSVSDLFENIH